MSTISLATLLKRQGQCTGGQCFNNGSPNPQPSSGPADSDGDATDGNANWYDSNTGYIVRYVILAVIVIFLLLWIFFGVWHANRRIKRGLPPLWYHRWLVPARHRYSQRQQAWPQYGPPGAPGTMPPGQAYPMYTWRQTENAPPPPMYSSDSPPGYAPPPGPPPSKPPGATTTTVTPVQPPQPAAESHRQHRDSAVSALTEPDAAHSGPNLRQ